MERLGGILETSWRRLGAAAAFDAALMLLQLVRRYLGDLKRLVVVLEALWTLLKASWSLRKPIENKL